MVRLTRRSLLLLLLAAAPAGADRGPSPPASTPAKVEVKAPDTATCDAACDDGGVESCRCLFQSTFEHACQSADAIFVGEVTTAERHASGSWRYTLRVTCSWKGDLGTAVAESGENGCPALLEKGRSYLVYATRKGARQVFEIGSCNRTADVTRAAADLKRLGEPQRKAAAGSLR